MEKLYVLAVRPNRRLADITVTDEMEEFIRERAGHEFLISPRWWSQPPFTKPQTLPVLVTEPVMRSLMLGELEDAIPDRIMHCARWDAADERDWRRVAREKNPLPDECGVFPWERVLFRINEADHDAAVLIEAFVRDPCEVRGDFLAVTPDDATVLLMLHPPGSFQFVRSSVLDEDISR